VTNLFAYCAAVPSGKASNAPNGSENDAWLNKLSLPHAAIIVAAWGNDGSYLNRS
jgi:hypothetical protein